jgi:hypothetical protein
MPSDAVLDVAAAFQRRCKSGNGISQMEKACPGVSRAGFFVRAL